MTSETLHLGSIIFAIWESRRFCITCLYHMYVCAGREEGFKMYTCRAVLYFSPICVKSMHCLPCVKASLDCPIIDFPILAYMRESTSTASGIPSRPKRPHGIMQS
jgi:hypothetical protein